MFPLNSNDQYIDNNGKRSTLGSAIGSGGGGGSTVSITPVLTEGTKIADYEIDGEGGSLYAPSGGGGSAPEIRCGISTNRTFAANGFNSFSENFSTPMPNTNYDVFISFAKSNSTALEKSMGVLITSKSTTGFEARIDNPNSELKSVLVQWLAISHA